MGLLSVRMRRKPLGAPTRPVRAPPIVMRAQAAQGGLASRRALWIPLRRRYLAGLAEVASVTLRAQAQKVTQWMKFEGGTARLGGTLCCAHHLRRRGRRCTN